MELILAGFIGLIVGLVILYASSPIDKENKRYPCKPDHNGECLICDCWLSECAYDRYLNEDYTHETKEQLEEIFKNTKQC